MKAFYFLFRIAAVSLGLSILPAVAEETKRPSATAGGTGSAKSPNRLQSRSPTCSDGKIAANAQHAQGAKDVD